MNDRISAQLADAHHGLREQLASAEKQFERLERLLAQRDSHDIADLNRAVRRLRQSSPWAAVLVETTQAFCDRAALFALKGNLLELQSSRNIARNVSEIPIPSAPAFRAAVETKDTVVAVRSAGELSQPFSAALGEAPDRKCYLFPIAARDGVVAVLYADSDRMPMHSDALEILANVAGALLDARPAQAPNGLVHIAQLDRLEPRQQEGDRQHKAQRFARVRVAEIRLYQSDEVKKGRFACDLYTSLKAEIDSARDVYRRDFLSAPGSTPDYLHLELLQTLANGEVELLGPQYPGPLV